MKENVVDYENMWYLESFVDQTKKFDLHQISRDLRLDQMSFVRERVV
jgi:hypothetical protein